MRAFMVGLSKAPDPVSGSLSGVITGDESLLVFRGYRCLRSDHLHDLVAGAIVGKASQKVAVGVLFKVMKFASELLGK